MLVVFHACARAMTVCMSMSNRVLCVPRVSLSVSAAPEKRQRVPSAYNRFIKWVPCQQYHATTFFMLCVTVYKSYGWPVWFSHRPRQCMPAASLSLAAAGRPTRAVGPGPVRGTDARTFAEEEGDDPDGFCSRSVVVLSIAEEEREREGQII